MAMSLSATGTSCNKTLDTGRTTSGKPGSSTGKAYNQNHDRAGALRLRSMLEQNKDGGRLLRVSRPARLVFTNIASYARKDHTGSWFAYPSIPTIARNLGYENTRQVYRLLNDLERAGLIIRVKGGGRVQNTYLLTAMNELDAQLLAEREQESAEQLDAEHQNAQNVTPALAQTSSEPCSESHRTPDILATPSREFISKSKTTVNNNSAANVIREREASTPPAEVVVVVGFLVEAGISRDKAEQLARTSNRCKDPLYVEHVIATSKHKSITNPLGFLLSRLKHDAPIVEGFSEHERKKQAENEQREKQQEKADRIDNKTREFLTELLPFLERERPRPYGYLAQTWPHPTEHGRVNIDAVVQARPFQSDEYFLLVTAQKCSPEDRMRFGYDILGRAAMNELGKRERELKRNGAAVTA